MIPTMMRRFPMSFYSKIIRKSPISQSFFLSRSYSSEANDQISHKKYTPKVAKGMRDFSPEQMAIREKVFETVRAVFSKHLAGQLDTPVMELTETLTEKYGEEGAKLIYNLADQGGEILSLRYDLTVPLARYVAMNRLFNWKRYQLGKVYRREQSQASKGRYREFYQCDFDIIGKGVTMIQEAEILKIIVEILEKLDLKFIIKVSHRLLLDALLKVAGCPIEKCQNISSSIDKLDKEDWNTVKQEMIEKGITEDVADSIGKYVRIKGEAWSILSELKKFKEITENETGNLALSELEKLFEFTDVLGTTQYLSLDLSLARGLDYYTGLIYEAILLKTDTSLGSIAGGGRYDNLIAKLSENKVNTPAVGVSLGVERIFAFLEEKYKNEKILHPKRSVLVAQAGSSNKYLLVKERLKICNLLWNGGIPCEMSYKEKSDSKGQAGYAGEVGIGFIVWIGESEIERGKVRVKSLNTHEETEVEINDLVSFINNKGYSAF
ncbi:unnamed protein product [Blepharisma stoltei]|uniref:Histidine--tRNA ligase, cytoplasmic n=1 Tax=Blepharisma stoltei TaxID=1481888 RepID=A0AAU9IP04_9CILI|nr:unnamed protein product [Blepharisma stoltei]